MSIEAKSDETVVVVDPFPVARTMTAAPFQIRAPTKFGVAGHALSTVAVDVGTEIETIIRVMPLQLPSSGVTNLPTKVASTFASVKVFAAQAVGRTERGLCSWAVT